MSRFVLRRLLYTLVIMWVASIVVFVALRITPGDVTNFVVTPIESPARVAQIRHQLGLDKPMIEQYLIFWQHLLHGDLGRSAVTGQPITTIIAKGAPYTLSLALAAGIITYGLGIPLGVLAALRRNTIVDHLATGIAVVGMGVPNFVLAILLIYLLAVTLRLLPVSGSGGIEYIILPAVVLALEPLAVTTRLMRSSMLDQLGQDYVRTLTAKGLTRWKVIWRHVVWNSLGPIISLAAVQVRSLLGYTLIVEVIFRWPGLGSRLVDVVLKRDYQPAQILALMLTLVVIFLNYMADVGYAAIDPRVRASASRS
jgi:ABC-type dipeptide/oligopeptide/nickel transport system permease component